VLGPPTRPASLDFYEYALRDTSGKQEPSRANGRFPRITLRFALESGPGVSRSSRPSEGTSGQYQGDLDPDKAAPRTLPRHSTTSAGTSATRTAKWAGFRDERARSNSALRAGVLQLCGLGRSPSRPARRNRSHSRRRHGSIRRRHSRRGLDRARRSRASVGRHLIARSATKTRSKFVIFERVRAKSPAQGVVPEGSRSFPPTYRSS